MDLRLPCSNAAFDWLLTDSATQHQWKWLAEVLTCCLHGKSEKMLKRPKVLLFCSNKPPKPQWRWSHIGPTCSSATCFSYKRNHSWIMHWAVSVTTLRKTELWVFLGLFLWRSLPMWLMWPVDLQGQHGSHEVRAECVNPVASHTWWA